MRLSLRRFGTRGNNAFLLTTGLLVAPPLGIYSVYDDSAGVSIVGGWHENSIGSGSEHSIIAAGGAQGNINTIGDGSYLGIISGGYDNAIGDNAFAGTIAGGAHHTIGDGTTHATICGGSTGTITADGDYGFIGGGLTNTINGTGTYGFIGAGTSNVVSGLRAAVLAGAGNTASGDYSYAFGRNTTTSGNGSVAFSDGTTTAFSVSTTDTFNAQFANGYLFKGGNFVIDAATATGLVQVDTASSGLVGIGQAPTYKLDVLGQSRFSTSSTNTAGYALIIENSGGTTTSDATVTFLRTGAQRFVLGVDGTDDSFRLADSTALGTTDRLIFDSTGLGSVGGATPTALWTMAGSSTSRASARIIDGSAPTTPNDGDFFKATAFTLFAEDATTNSVVDTLTLRRSSSGTPAAGFGGAVRLNLKSSSTANQSGAVVKAEWNVATHASRSSDLTLSAYYTSTEREGLRIRGGASDTQIGFYGVTPISRAVLATGAGRTVDDVITALQNLGLVKQS